MMIVWVLTRPVAADVKAYQRLNKYGVDPIQGSWPDNGHMILLMLPVDGTMNITNEIGSNVGVACFNQFNEV